MYYDSDQTDVDSVAVIDDDRGVIRPRSWTFRLILLQPSDDDHTATSRLHLDEDPALPSFHMASGKPSNRRRFHPSDENWIRGSIVSIRFSSDVSAKR